MPEISDSVWDPLGVYWGAAPGLPADHPHPAAAAGAHGRAGSQTAPVWRLAGNCGTTKHHGGPGKQSVSGAPPDLATVVDPNGPSVSQIFDDCLRGSFKTNLIVLSF